MKKLRKIEEILAGLILLSAVMLVFANVVLRRVFASSSTWIEELVRYLIIWITFIGSSICFSRGTHMGIDLVFTLVKNEKLQRVIKIFILLASMVFMIFMLIFGIKLVQFTKASGQISPSLEIKLYIMYLALPIGAIMSILEIILNIIDIIKKDSTTIKEA